MKGQRTPTKLLNIFTITKPGQYLGLCFIIRNRIVIRARNQTAFTSVMTWWRLSSKYTILACDVMVNHQVHSWELFWTQQLNFFSFTGNGISESVWLEIPKLRKKWLNARRRSKAVMGVGSWKCLFTYWLSFRRGKSVSPSERFELHMLHFLLFFESINQHSALISSRASQRKRERCGVQLIVGAKEIFPAAKNSFWIYALFPSFDFESFAFRNRIVARAILKLEELNIAKALHGDEDN